MSLKDKVVIIMGASSGIGAATAELLAQKDVKLVIVARRLDRLNKIKEKYPDKEILAIAADVSDIKDVKHVVKETKKVYGHIDVMWNNAGVMPLNKLRVGARDEWKRLVNINFYGVLNGIDAVLPTMIEQGYGHIIATDSIAGLRTGTNNAVYSATKYAVRSLMQGVRIEEGPNGIKATTIFPGQMDTELTKTIENKDLKKQISKDLKGPSMTVLKPDEVAQVVANIIDTPANMSVDEIVLRPTAEKLIH